MKAILTKQSLIFSSAIIGFTTLWVWFFWQILTPVAGDRFILDQTGDFYLHFFAPIQYQVERLSQGQFPLWNPYNYGGMPLAANIQYGFFYLPRYIGVLLTGAENWTVYSYQIEIAVHYWLASVLMFTYLWVIVKQPLLAFIGGVLFAYSGYLTGYPMLQGSTVETEAWIPLALLGVHLIMTRRPSSPFHFAITAIAIGLMLVAGRPQAALYLIYLIALYGLFVGVQAKRHLVSIIWRLGVIFGLGFALAAVQLLPMAELTRESFRVESWNVIDKGGGFSASELMRLFWGRLGESWSALYAGVAGLVLAGGTLLRRRQPIENFWLGVGLLALVLSLGRNTALFDFFYAFVPGHSMFRNQERTASIVAIALAMLAVYQLRWLFFSNADHERSEAPPDEYKRFVWASSLYVAFLGVMAVIMVLMAHAEQDIYVFTFAIGALFLGWVFWFKAEKRPIYASMGLLLVVIVLDLFTVGTRSINYVPDTPANHTHLHSALTPLITPENEIEWRIDGAMGLQGRGTTFRIPDIYGLGPISLDVAERMVRVPVPVHIFWDVFSVRYVTSRGDLPDVELELIAYGTNYEGIDYELLEIVNPRPMAHLVYDYGYAENNRDFAREIMAHPELDIRNFGVTLDPLPFDLPVQRPEVAEVNNFRMITPEQIEMDVSTGANALLTLSIINYPGWKAFVNDEPVKIYDNYAGLMGIAMRSGKDQHVKLVYEPETVRIGAIISAVALGIVMLLGIINPFYHRTIAQRFTRSHIKPT